MGAQRAAAGGLWATGVGCLVAAGGRGLPLFQVRTAGPAAEAFGDELMRLLGATTLAAWEDGFLEALLRAGPRNDLPPARARGARAGARPRSWAAAAAARSRTRRRRLPRPRRPRTSCGWRRWARCWRRSALRWARPPWPTWA